MTAQIFVGLPQETKKAIHETRVQRILDTVCDTLGVSRDQVSGISRLKTHTEARCIFIGLIYEIDPLYGLLKMGALLSNRHHSTVIYNRDLYKDLYKRDKGFTLKVEAVRAAL